MPQSAHLAVRIYGWSRQELIGQPFWSTVQDSEKKIAETRLQTCLAGERIRDVQCTRVTKAGRELVGTLTLHMLTDNRGQPDAICLLARHPTG